MKIYTYACFITLLISSCTLKSGNDKTDNDPEQSIRKQAIELSANYANNALSGAKKTITNDGSIIFSLGDTEYLINPSNIITGEIDEDSYKDAIVTIFISHGQRLPLKEHLILINNKEKLSISKELSGEMKFLSISDRTIYIETSKMAADSPLADCQVCKEIKKYRFIGGDTVRIK